MDHRENAAAILIKRKRYDTIDRGTYSYPARELTLRESLLPRLRLPCLRGARGPRSARERRAPFTVDEKSPLTNRPGEIRGSSPRLLAFAAICAADRYLARDIVYAS